MVAACTTVTQLGNDCEAGICMPLSSCDMASQQLPPSCDGMRNCAGAEIPEDTLACDNCIATNDELHIVNRPIVKCACAHCAAQLVACFDSAAQETDGDRTRDNFCRQIVECGWAAKCVGSDCFCGTGVDRVTCLTQATGPCRRLILEASQCAGAPDGEGYCALAAQADHSTAVGRASEVALCVTGDPLVTSDIEPQCSVDLYKLN
jgi:hypothetical protein